MIAYTRAATIRSIQPGLQSALTPPSPDDIVPHHCGVVIRFFPPPALGDQSLSQKPVTAVSSSKAAQQ